MTRPRRAFYEENRKTKPSFSFKSQAINSRNKWTQRTDIFCNNEEAAWIRNELEKLRKEKELQITKKE